MDRFLMRLDNEGSLATAYQTDIEGSYGHLHLLLFMVGLSHANGNLEWRSGRVYPAGKRAILNWKPYQTQYTNCNKDRRPALRRAIDSPGSAPVLPHDRKRQKHFSPAGKFLFLYSPPRPSPAPPPKRASVGHPEETQAVDVTEVRQINRRRSEKSVVFRAVASWPYLC
jgi:hypothetical protein